MMNSNLNLNTLPECKFAYRMVNSALLIPCIEYQRMLRMEKVSQIAENFSEYIANEPKVSYRDGRFYVFDGQNTVEARRTCNGGKDVTIRCKVFYGLTKEDEATLFAIQTGNATCLTAGERLRANLVAENPDALYFVGITSNAVWNLPMTASGHPGKSTASKRHTSCTNSMAVSATSRCFASSTRRGRAMWIPTLPV
jgi:hypothetical protein